MKTQWLLIFPLLFASGCDDSNVKKEKVKPPKTARNVEAHSDGGALVLKKPSPPPAIGESAREIEGPDLDGVVFKLSDYRGKVIVLSFWGELNPISRKIYPQGRSLVKQLADKPFAFIGVNSDTDIEKIREFVNDEKLGWRSFQNQRPEMEPISKEWGVRDWPTLYVIDTKWKIRFYNVQGKELDQAIELLLKEAGNEVTISHPDEIEKSDSKPADSKGS